MIQRVRHKHHPKKNPLKTRADLSFPKTSVFGKATLDLHEKAAFGLLFPKPFPKLTEFGDWLNWLKFSGAY
jgi:hypothetical protein